MLPPVPRATFVSPTTERLLESLPFFMRRSADVQGTVDALAAELDRLEARMQDVTDGFFPQTADEWVGIIETQLGLPVNPPDATVSQRQIRALAFLQHRADQGEGISWQEQMTKLLGSGWTYQEHDPADPSSPPANTIRVSFPYSQAIVPPTGLAATPSAGGSLLAATYSWVVTAVNAYGETTVSTAVPETFGSPGQKVSLTWTAVAGATSYRVYRNQGGGVFGRVGTPSSPAFVDDGTVTPTVAPPQTNTTQSPQASLAKQLARQFTHAHIDLVFGYQAGFLFGISGFGDSF